MAANDEPHRRVAGCGHRVLLDFVPPDDFR